MAFSVSDIKFKMPKTDGVSQAEFLYNSNTSSIIPCNRISKDCHALWLSLQSTKYLYAFGDWKCKTFFPRGSKQILLTIKSLIGSY